MNKLFISLALLLWSLLGYSQITFERSYGGVNFEIGNSVVQIPDGGYIIAGSIGISPDVNHAWLVKTNEQGDTLWTKTLGSNYSDGANCVAPTSDGGYIMIGSRSDGVYADVLLYKTDANGDSLWTRTFGGINDDNGNSLVQTYDGGYALTGYMTISGGNKDAYLIKTDTYGYAEWVKTYGGNLYDAGFSIIQTPDSGFIILAISSTGIGATDIFLIRTDVHGDTLWTRTYGGAFDDQAVSIEMTIDGGYIIAGLTNSFGVGGVNIYLIKINAVGDTLWTKTYGGGDSGYARSVVQISNGDYVVAGTIEYYGAGYIDAFLLKTNVDGDLLWMQTFGDTHDDYGNCVKQAYDGGYIITGMTNSNGVGNYDMYLIKTDANGQLAGIDDMATASDTPLLIYPNPSSGNIRLQVPPAFGPIASIAVYNYLGALQYEQTGFADEIDLSALRSGMYFIVVRNGSGERIGGEVVRE